MPEKEPLGYMQKILSEERLRESIEWHKQHETEDKHAVIETDMSVFKECKVEDVPEYLFARYLNHLIMQLCWEVIRKDVEIEVTEIIGEKNG